MSDLVKRLQRSHTQLIRDEEFVLILKTHVDDAAASIERKDAALRMALDVISTILADENALDCIFEKDKQKLRDAASAISAALKE